MEQFRNEEAPYRYDQQMTVFIRSTRGSEDDWMSDVVSRLTGNQNHRMITNVEVTPEMNDRLTQTPGEDNEVVSIQTTEQSRGIIRFA